MKARVRFMAITLFTLGCLGAGPIPEDGHSVLYAPQRVPLDWWVVNDTVMGGRSSSTWSETDAAIGIFKGYLSLENNGGFTSVRSSDTGLLSEDVSTIKIKVRGDGRRYRFSVRSRRVQRGVSYQQPFDTVANEWVVVEMPLLGFEPRWRGRSVSGAPELRPQDIQSVGFLLADKKEGEFRLDVAEITSVHASSDPRPE